MQGEAMGAVHKVTHKYSKKFKQYGKQTRETNINSNINSAESAGKCVITEENCTRIQMQLLQ